MALFICEFCFFSFVVVNEDLYGEYIQEDGFIHEMVWMMEHY